MAKTNREKRNYTLINIGVALVILLLFLLFSTYKMEFSKEKNIMNSSHQTSPEKNWKVDNIFLPIINKRIERNNIPKLEDENRPKESKEIRLWVGFTENRLKGLILKNNQGVWSAAVLSHMRATRDLPSR